MLVGSTVDSVFNEMRRSQLIPSEKLPIELRDNPQPNIGNYRETFGKIYQLSEIELSVHYGLTNYGTIKPFDAFGLSKTPEWWEAYNNVKHEFFQNMHEGTLDHLVRALGGLFALNIIHKDSQQYLINIGVISGSLGLGPHFTGAHIWSWLKESFIGSPHNVASDVWARSQVFQHMFRRDESVSIDSSF